MTHEEIQKQELAEEYVRGRLDEAQRSSFEDHYFACDVCFAHVQELQRFTDGVKDAVRAGQLPLSHGGAGWLRPAFSFAAAASLALATLAGWSIWIDKPRWQAQTAQARDEIGVMRGRVETMEKELASARAAASRGPASIPNLPLLMLEATRAEGVPAFALAPDAPQIALWMEPPPADDDARYQLEVRTQAGEMAESLEGLTRNPYGALAVAIPTQKLRYGGHVAKLFVMYKGGQRSLVGDYRFEIRKR